MNIQFIYFYHDGFQQSIMDGRTYANISLKYVLAWGGGWGSGVDPGFLEREFVTVEVWRFDLLILSNFIKYPMKMK